MILLKKNLYLSTFRIKEYAEVCGQIQSMKNWDGRKSWMRVGNGEILTDSSQMLPIFEKRKAELITELAALGIQVET